MRTGINFKITGYVSKDAEIKYSQSGTAYTRVGVPYTPRKKNPQTGAWEDAGETLWINATIFNEAEEAANHLKKGTMVTLEGRPELSTWTDQSGQQRTDLNLLVSSWAIHPKPSQSGGQGGFQAGSQGWGRQPLNPSQAPF